MSNVSRKNQAPGRWLRLGLLALLTLGLGGCQVLGDRICEMTECTERMSPPDDEPTASEQFLSYLDGVAEMPAERRETTYQVLRQNTPETGCDERQLRLAGLFMLHPTPPREDSEFLAERLDACWLSRRHTDVSAGLVRVLHTQIVNRDSLETRAQELERGLAQERQRNTELAEQLEALKAIERSIHQRGQGNSRED